jgi:hypothetical protein
METKVCEKNQCFVPNCWFTPLKEYLKRFYTSKKYVLFSKNTLMLAFTFRLLKYFYSHLA